MDKNEEILDVLEGKTVGVYIKEYYTLRNKIETLFEKMKNHGVNCDCDDSEDYFTINEGYAKEEQHICIDCGGMMELNNQTW